MEKAIKKLDTFIAEHKGLPLLDRTYIVCHLLGGMLEDHESFDGLEMVDRVEIEEISEKINDFYQQVGARQANQQAH